MSGWLRFENSTAENPKLVPLSDRAFRLWFNACCYCSRTESDGLVPRAIVTRLSRTATRAVVEELVAAGRFEPVDDTHYRVHDYLEHNPSRARLSKMRGAAKDRTKRWRDGGGDGNSDASQIRHSRAGAPVPLCNVVASSVGEGTSKEAKARQASKRVDQGALPLTLPGDLHHSAHLALTVLRAIHAERGGNEPTLRGVGLAVARFPDRDHARVVRKLEHWALAGSGQWKPVVDWCRTYATFLEGEPAGSPVKVSGNGAAPASSRDARRAGRVAAMERLTNGGDAA